nr:hypothetical protein [Tanacetum cinerariifolium]
MVQRLGKGSAIPTDPQHIPIIIQPSSSQVPQPSGPTESVADEAVYKELDKRLARAATTASKLEAEQDSGNISKTQFKETPNEPSSQETNSGGGPRFESVSKQSNDSLLVRGNTLQSDEDILKLDKLMALCTTLQNKVLDLEKTTTTQCNEITSFKRKVKKFEKRNRSRTHGLKRLYKVGLSTSVESSGDEESLGEDASKQERRINAIDADEDITLVSVSDNEMFDVDDLGGEEVLVAGKKENDYNASSAVPCLFSHSIYVIPCLYIRSLSVVLSRISFHVLYDRGVTIMVSEPGYETVGSKDLTCEDWMVNTCTDTDLSATVQNALQTLLPQIRAEIREEFRTSSGPSDSGGNPPPVTIYTWLERFNKQKPRSFEKATAPLDAKNWISHMEKIFDVMGCEDAFKTRLAVYKFEGNVLACFSLEFMQRFLRLAGFLGTAAGTEEEQAKNFQWRLCRSTLNYLMCMSYTDVAQVANAARNYEILHERDDDDAERPDKRQKSGDRHQPTSQQSSHMNHGHSKDRHGSDRREDEVWKMQNGYKVLESKLYDSCRVYSLMMKFMQIYMLVEKKYLPTPPTLLMRLKKKLIIDYESEMAYHLFKLIKKQLKN